MIEYIGEHAWAGQLGHTLAIISLVGAILGTMGYYLGTVRNADEWIRLGRIGFRLHSVAVLGVVVTLFTMHLLCAIPNPGKYLEFSIEGPDYYPWQQGLYVESPYKIKDGHIELPVSPGWGVEIHPDWLQRASYQMTEVS